MGTVRLMLAGELDIATMPRFEAALGRAQAEAALIVVDLRALEFMAASSLRLLLEVARRVRAMGGRLVIVRGPAAVERLFEIVGVDLQLELVDQPPGRLRLPRSWRPVAA